MRFTLPCLLGICLTTMHFVACSKSETLTDGKVISPEIELVAPLHHCGEVSLMEARGANGASLGVFEVQNDSSDLWVTFSPSGDLKLEAMSIYAGALERCPSKGDGSADYASFPLRKTGLHRAKPFSTKILIPKPNDCFFLSAFVKLSSGKDTLLGWIDDGKGESTMPGFQHCVSACTVADVVCDLAESSSPPLTLTQSAWTDKFDKPYSGMLESDFATLFPKGLSLGCNNKISLTSAKDILHLLPLSGAPKVLEGNLTNPARTNCDNQLVGELCALVLTVKFDEAYDHFSKPNVRLSQLEVATGAFADWKVEEVIQEANAVLGNCASNYTPNQLYEVLKDINRNSAQDDSSGVFLRCPRF
jgi:hypothetical protein